MKKLNNRGFAVSGILYPILVLFLMLIIGALGIMSSRKAVFDQTKNEIITELNDPNSLNAPQIKVTGMDVTVLNNKNISGFNFDLKENVSAISSDKTAFSKNEIMVSSEPAFNQGKTGVYKITYSVTDRYAKRATATRTVRVVDLTANVNYWSYPFTGSYQTLTIPSNGLYQVEAWGASGYGGTYGGKGAYTRGQIELMAHDQLYTFVGEAGSRKVGIYNTTNITFNGGGSYVCGNVRYTGGGASDVRVVKPNASNDDWGNSESLAGRIMVAAGGGGAGQTSKDNNPTIAGGAGGTLSSKGGNGPSRGKGATQDTGTLGIGGSTGDATKACGSSNGSAGGGGYRGGYATAYAGSSGAGGSSYISGFDGCKVYASKIFHNAVMIPGTAVMPKHDGTGTMTGNSGNGYIKILQLKVVND